MIAATLTGPQFWAPNHDEHSIEVFANLGEAVEALMERYRSNGRLIDITYLDGTTYSAAWPGFDVDCGFQCYRVAGFEDVPLEEVDVEEVLTAVHSGYFDWHLTLTTHGEDNDVAVLAVPA